MSPQNQEFLSADEIYIEIDGTRLAFVQEVSDTINDNVEDVNVLGQSDPAGNTKGQSNYELTLKEVISLDGRPVVPQLRGKMFTLVQVFPYGRETWGGCRITSIKRSFTAKSGAPAADISIKASSYTTE